MIKKRERKKRCKVCLRPLKDNKICINVDGCPLARVQKEMENLEK